MRNNRFKDLYGQSVTLDDKPNSENFVDVALNDLQKQEEESSIPEPVPEPIPTTQLIDVTDKSKVGRPKVYEEESKVISVRLKMSNYEQARTIGGLYGGYTGYINYLIEQDIKQRKVNK